MCKKSFHLTRRAAVIALCWCATPTPSALADNTAACVAKVSAYVAELDQLLATKIPRFRPHEIGPYVSSNANTFRSATAMAIQSSSRPLNHDSSRASDIIPEGKPTPPSSRTGLLGLGSPTT